MSLLLGFAVGCVYTLLAIRTGAWLHQQEMDEKSDRMYREIVAELDESEPEWFGPARRN